MIKLVKGPHAFNNVQEIITNLIKHKSTAIKWFERRSYNKEKLIRDSVDSNTFRAFAHMPCQPSVVFRDWASWVLNDDAIITQLISCISEQQYDEWHGKICNNLCSYWYEKMGTKMAYGPSRKLPNLLMKEFVLWVFLKEDDRKEIIKYLHIPLDKYSLVGVRKCINEFKEREKISMIPKNATMSYVSNEIVYYNLQHIMRIIGKKGGVPPIYLDILFWNTNH